MVSATIWIAQRTLSGEPRPSAEAMPSYLGPRVELARTDGLVVDVRERHNGRAHSFRAEAGEGLGEAALASANSRWRRGRERLI
jgi:hypothetical protein